MLRLFIYTIVGLFLLTANAEAKSWWDKFSLGATETPTIAVLSNSDFIPDRTGVEKATRKGLPDALAERIMEHLAQSKRFIVAERQALRRVVTEQHFGEKKGKDYLERTLDKAIGDMDDLESSFVLGVAASASNYKDQLQDFQDLGRAVKADYLLVGNLEKMVKSTKTKNVPYSTMGRKSTKATVDARLRLRVIKTETGTVLGATSTRVKISENIFAGRESDTDDFTAFDHIARIASVKVLDAVYPAAVAGVEPLVITRGSNDGIKSGDLFQIKRPGKMIKDPSGIELGRVLSDVGTVKVSQLQNAISVAELISGKAPEEGDVAIYDVEEGLSLQSAKAPTKAAPKVSNDHAAAMDRPRVAVGLLKVGTTAKRVEEDSFNNFTDTLISRLSQTKRFQVVDRQEVDQLLNEQTLEAMSNNTDLSSAVGSITAADYLVIGSVSVFDVNTKTTHLKTAKLDMTKQDVSGVVQGNMRIVDARTGDILASRKVLVNVDLDEDASENEILAALSDAYAEEVVSELMQTLFPIKVAAVGGDGTIYINRGNDGGLQVGEKVKAYRAGGEIKDPDTGISLGFTETMVGEIILSEVEDARSKGTLVSNGVLQPGDIVKRAAGAQKTHLASKAPGRSGGAIDQDKAAAPVKGRRYTLAIGSITVDSALQSNMTHERLSLRLTDNLVSGLTQAKRFKVMDRKGIDEVMGEKSFETFMKGGKLKDRLKELDGADYLILGDVTVLKMTETTKKVPYVNAVQITRQGRGEGTIRIVDVHTGAIVASEQINISPMMMEKDTGRSPEGLDESFNFLIAKYAEASVQSIVNGLFPIKVIGVSADDHVFINRGSDGQVLTGQVYNVLRPGEEMKDEDTGLSFGRIESKIAKIKITSVERARAKGVVVAGGIPVKGDIVRMTKATDAAARRVKQEKPAAKIRTPNW